MLGMKNIIMQFDNPQNVFYFWITGKRIEFELIEGQTSNYNFWGL